MSALLAVLTLVGAVLIFFAGRQLYLYQWRLPKERLITTGTVDEWRTTTGRRQPTRYQVRYHFTVPGEEAVYRPEETLLWWHRENLWVTIDQNVWEDSQRTGEIEVEYSTEDPTLNQPVAGRRTMFEAIVGGSVGALLVAIGAIWWWPLLRRPGTGNPGSGPDTQAASV
ncbi:MAG TPA: hypothetical protein VHJ82_02310 [Actinomycetota bacterium]|nr:hypothetical protein [Actinomycetota bacterium]